MPPKINIICGTVDLIERNDDENYELDGERNPDHAAKKRVGAFEK